MMRCLSILFVCAAMSFPASGVETAYRNNLKDVAKMLKTKHQENYMVLHCSIAISTTHIHYWFS